MKIAFLVNSFPTLSQTFIINQITGLLEKGIDIDIYSEFRNEHSIMHKDVIDYKLMDRVQFYTDTIPKSKMRRVLKASGNMIGNIHKYPSQLMKSANFVKYGEDAKSLTLFYRSLYFLKQSNSERIYHCHFGPIGNLAVTLKEIGAINGKIITTFYGYDVSDYVKKRGQNIYDKLFSRGDLFLVLSNKMRERLISLGCDEKKILIHHLGIDTSKYKPIVKKYKKGDTIRILTIGRFVEKKGLEYAIKAVNQLLNRYPAIKYEIIGDGELRSKMEQIINECGISENVKLLGWQEQSVVRKKLNECDIFVAPSVTASNGDEEGTPTTIIEAQASGVPVVSTYHSGIPEMVVDGKTGFLVPERNVDELARKIEYLILNPELWQKMGMAGREHMVKEFDINNLSNRLIEIYKTV